MVKDVIIPFAKEQGFDFSIEDIKEFEQSIVEQLDEEQLKDISAAGNFLPVGTGATICKVIGIGLLGFSNDRHSWGFCCLLGFGLGAGACAIVGVSSY